jgi:hypothetical protein
LFTRLTGLASGPLELRIKAYTKFAPERADLLGEAGHALRRFLLELRQDAGHVSPPPPPAADAV